VSFSAVRRVSKSAVPPGGNGTMMRTGFDGYGCAPAAMETTVSAVSNARRNYDPGSEFSAVSSA